MAHSPVAPLLDFEGRIVSLLGTVGEVEINLLVDLLLRLDAESGKEITLYLSSQGADMVQALKVLDTLRMLRSSVTAVAFGLVDGAGVVVLAACPRRVVFPSVVLSTAGLWALPIPHPDLRQPMGLGVGSDPRHQFIAKVTQQVQEAFAAAPLKMPAILADAAQPPRLFNAEEAIEAGLADRIITGSERRLFKPVTEKHPAYAHPHSLTL